MNPSAPPRSAAHPRTNATPPPTQTGAPAPADLPDPNSAMDPYDRTLVPAPFGLNNTGAICYLNSFLQVLAGCSSFTRAVLQNKEYLRQTRTGTAVLNFVESYASQGPVPGIEYESAHVLGALQTDLRARRPNVRFGAGQESASEALVHLLDMMEPPKTLGGHGASGKPPASPDGLPVESSESPITRLFLHRFRCDTHCRQCRGVVSRVTDYAVNFNLFHIDGLREPPVTVAKFSDAIRLQISTVEGYSCESCAAGQGNAVRSTGYRVYNLTMIPEIVFCMFNIYAGYGPVRRLRYFPDRLEIPASQKGMKHVFRLVGQIEHSSGSLEGGHYWARALRAGGVYLFNDASVSPASFVASPTTYIIAYHYDRTTAAEPTAAMEA